MRTPVCVGGSCITIEYAQTAARPIPPIRTPPARERIKPAPNQIGLKPKGLGAITEPLLRLNTRNSQPWLIPRNRKLDKSFGG